MTILWITEHYYPNQGGMAQSCERIVSGLRDLGLCIDVFHLAKVCRRRTLGNKKTGEDHCWPLGDSPSHGLNLLWNWLEQNQQGRQYSKVVVYGTHYALVSGQNFASWLDVPLFAFVRGNDFDTAIFDSKRRQMIESLYNDASTVFCVSQDKKEKISRLFKSANPVWVANGIDLAQWQVRASHKLQQNKVRQSLSQDKKIIGLFGHIKDKKGALFLIEAIALADLSEHFHLLIVGDLDDITANRLSAENNDITYTIFPFTDRNQLIPYYLSCDCVAIPSFYDGMPNVMLEAAALAVPILSSQVGGMKDVLVHGESALMFAAGNKDECRSLLAFIAYHQGDELLNLGLNAQQVIEQNYLAEHEAQHYYPYFMSQK